MRIHRTPGRPLDRFVQRLWACDDQPLPGVSRERVLPTGMVHLVLRLSPAPLIVFQDALPFTVGHLVVGGPRLVSYLRDVSRPMRAVGAHLRPGAAAAVLGVGAGALAGRHTSLIDLDRGFVEWGERLAAIDDPRRQLAVFEDLLTARLRGELAVHAAVEQALAGLRAGRPVGDIARRSGASHRRLIALFREAVGLTPKAYARLLRFRRALAHPTASWAEVALAAGYSDQAHLTREFQTLGGLTPGAYRAATASGHHVPA